MIAQAIRIRARQTIAVGVFDATTNAADWRTMLVLRGTLGTVIGTHYKSARRQVRMPHDNRPDGIDLERPRLFVRWDVALIVDAPDEQIHRDETTVDWWEDSDVDPDDVEFIGREDAATADAAIGAFDARPLWTFSRARANEIAGRDLTDEEAARIATALEHSSLPDVLDAVVFGAVGSVAR